MKIDPAKEQKRVQSSTRRNLAIGAVAVLTIFAIPLASKLRCAEPAVDGIQTTPPRTKEPSTKRTTKTPNATTPAKAVPNCDPRAIRTKTLADRCGFVGDGICNIEQGEDARNAFADCHCGDGKVQRNVEWVRLTWKAGNTKGRLVEESVTITESCDSSDTARYCKTDCDANPARTGKRPSAENVGSGILSCQEANVRLVPDALGGMSNDLRRGIADLRRQGGCEIDENATLFVTLRIEAGSGNATLSGAGMRCNRSGESARNAGVSPAQIYEATGITQEAIANPVGIIPAVTCIKTVSYSDGGSREQ